MSASVPRSTLWLALCLGAVVSGCASTQVVAPPRSLPAVNAELDGREAVVVQEGGGSVAALNVRIGADSTRYQPYPGAPFVTVATDSVRRVVVEGRSEGRAIGAAPGAALVGLGLLVGIAGFGEEGDVPDVLSYVLGLLATSAGLLIAVGGSEAGSALDPPRQWTVYEAPVGRYLTEAAATPADP